MTNTAPTFPNGTILANLTIGVNATSAFSMPAYSDLEMNPITVYTYESGQLVLPAFITFADPVFTIHPTLFTQIGTFQVQIDLSDGEPLTTSYNFFVTVTNTAPSFPVGTTFSNQTLGINASTTFSIPAYSDLEMNPVTFSTY